MKAFIISLPSATERRRRITSMMLRAETPFEIVDAIAGAEIESTVSAYCPRRFCLRHRYDLSLNEIACCLSHRAAQMAFLESDHRYGLILEDDAHMEPPAFGILRTIDLAAMNFDILKIGGNEKASGRLVRISGGIDILAVAKPSMGAYAYVVSRIGAEKLIAAAVPVRHQYDSYIRHGYMHGCIILETTPHLASHDDFGVSDIGIRSKTNRPITPEKLAMSSLWQVRHNILRLGYRIRRFGFARL